MSGFRLYPAPAAWWSFSDYQAVLDVMARTGARRVLEFGPGSSTLSLIEGGATSIDTLEARPEWADVYEGRLAKRFPAVVRLHRYEWSEPLSIPAVDAQRFDLALIDGPRETERRPHAIAYALDRCRWVLVAAEEWETRPFLRPRVEAEAARRGLPLEAWTTGPLAGAFLLVGPTEADA